MVEYRSLIYDGGSLNVSVRSLGVTNKVSHIGKSLVDVH